MEGLERFFLYCSDTDSPTLDFANTLDKKSRRYQINYGRLVLIPTALAFLGTAHVMSDFTTEPLVYWGVGLLVGWIVFTIDRSIIATYEKKETGLGKQFWWRLLLSVIMGFIIALFFIFYFFQNRIDAQIQENLMVSNAEIDAFYNNQNDSIADNDLKEREKYINYLKEVRQAEQDGIRQTFSYGMRKDKTTGQRGDKISTQSRSKEIAEEQAKYDSMQAEIQRRKNEIETDRIAAKEKNEDAAKKQDPLIKLEMLIKIINQHPLLLIMVIPLYLFLLALDIIPLLVKELAQITKYDNLYRNKKLSEVNLDFTEYDNKTQEYFEQMYVQGHALPTNHSEKNAMKGIIREEIVSGVKEQSWLELWIVGLICGLAIWMCQRFWGISISQAGVMSIFLSVIVDPVKTGLHKVSKRIVNEYNLNKQQE